MKKWFQGIKSADIISLGMLESISPIDWLKIRKSFESCQKFLTADKQEWRSIGLTSIQIEALINRPTNTSAAERLLDSKQIHLLTLDDPNYPPLLKNIDYPPLWLYYKGEIKTAHQIALTIVGTSKPSSYAVTTVTSLLSEELIRHIAIVSGLAPGIEKAVQQRSVECEGRSVVVLAGGLDVIDPISHYRLADEIIKSGGVLISEYPPLDRPKPWKLSFRNRILAGLSLSTMVIEAKIKSDPMQVAKLATAYHRDLWAVPGDITRRQSEGANLLIKRGAVLLDQRTQLEEYYGLRTPRSQIENLSDEPVSAA